MKRFTLYLSTTLLMLSAAPAFGSIIQWKVEGGGNNHHYQLLEDERTQLAAEIQSGQLSYGGITGHLATIGTAEENLFLTTTLGTEALSGKWLGGFQPMFSPEPDESWGWTTGEEWLYTNWADGQPEATLPPGNGLRFSSSG
ncbi:MAG: hypothetical protein WDZ79_00080, partial [Candidatus Paceibacterota bacterium]